MDFELTTVRQEQLEADIEYARKLQGQFNDEIVSKKKVEKTSDTKASSKPKTER
jgi:hypothetical protein